MAYSRDFGRIFRNVDYWIELKRLLFKLFRITNFRTRSDKSIRSSILSKLKKELASHFARCGLTDRSDFNLAYVAESQYKTGYAATKNGRYGNLQHTFFTNGISFVQKEHYSSTYLLLYHCANDWFVGQLHKCSLHHKNMRLCGFVKWRQYSKGT
jgi:hypothetical protein